MHALRLAALTVLVFTGTTPAAGRYLDIRYPASDKKGELQLGVTYTLWLPDGVKTFRGVIVHQHGCGAGACKGGETAAYDLHWQALAKKWDCALLGPSYHQEDKQDCRLWCDPRNGSAKTFVRALGEFAAKAKHPELAEVPWCLWGHSGGGMWASTMQALYPERIVAIWLRSGTAFGFWEKGEIIRPTLTAAAYGVPVMVNPGIKEKGDKRFGALWVGCYDMVRAYRAKGAPIGFAPDPRTEHECGDSRYLSVPFFDTCLAMRLPEKGVALRPVDMTKAWLGKLDGDEATSGAEYKGKPEDAGWLPTAAFAAAWREYVKDGVVSDKTDPPSPTNVKAVSKDGATVLTWDAEADLESGVQAFVILRDGKEVARLPEKAAGRKGSRPLFQGLSYHDTPTKPLPEMRYVDKDGQPGARYAVIAVNGAGLRSKAAGP